MRITKANLIISSIINIVLSRTPVIVKMISFNLCFSLVICILVVIIKRVNVVGCAKLL